LDFWSQANPETKALRWATGIYYRSAFTTVGSGAAIRRQDKMKRRKPRGWLVITSCDYWCTAELSRLMMSYAVIYVVRKDGTIYMTIMR
jgi:hypothetical protein